MLEVRGISAGYGDVQVLFSLSLSVNEKEIVTLLGSNGAGKTTTLRCICGVVPPRNGEVLFKGESLVRAPAAERAGMGIALVPEGRELWPQLTVRENLELGAYHGRARARSKQNLDRVNTLFPRLLERKSQVAGSLSGGEPQMCAIERALMPHQGESARAGGRVLASGDEKARELRGGDLIVGSEPERRIEGAERRLAIAERQPGSPLQQVQVGVRRKSRDSIGRSRDRLAGAVDEEEERGRLPIGEGRRREEAEHPADRLLRLPGL